MTKLDNNNEFVYEKEELTLMISCVKCIENGNKYVGHIHEEFDLVNDLELTLKECLVKSRNTAIGFGWRFIQDSGDPICPECIVKIPLIWDVRGHIVVLEE